MFLKFFSSEFILIASSLTRW